MELMFSTESTDQYSFGKLIILIITSHLILFLVKNLKNIIFLQFLYLRTTKEHTHSRFI